MHGLPLRSAVLQTPVPPAQREIAAELPLATVRAVCPPLTLLPRIQ